MRESSMMWVCFRFLVLRGEEDRDGDGDEDGVRLGVGGGRPYVENAFKSAVNNTYTEKQDDPYRMQ